NPGDAEQARLLVKELFQGPGIHAMPVQEVQQHAGIERPATRSHGQAVQGGEAHRAGDALPAAQGAQAGAVAEMGDDRTAGRGARRGNRKPPWTTRGPTAATWWPPRAPTRPQVNRNSMAPGCPRFVPAGHSCSPMTSPAVSWARKRGRVRIPSSWPRNRGRGR